MAGGPGAPAPGEATRIAGGNFTWGFGNFAENVELLRWMRTYNDDPGHRQKLRFYGIDLSLGGPQGSTPTPAAIENAMRYLATVDAPAAARLQAQFAPLLRHLPGDPSAPITAAEHDSLTAAIDALATQIATERTRYVAASSEEAYAWALRNATVARQGDRVHRAEIPSSPGGGIPPGAWRALNARDSAMAANVLWVLDREGARGRVLVFAHDMHVKNAPTVGGPWRLERPPTVMGQHLRATLGDAMVIFAGVGGSPKPDSSADLDAALARVGTPRFAIDLRRARGDSAARPWLAREHGLRVNADATITLRPLTAFDAVVYMDSLTPARPNRP